MFYRVLSVFLIMFLPLEAQARPVSYPGGWTAMAQSNWELHRFHFHYSPTAKYSLGVSTEYFREDDVKTLNLQVNRLLFRKNSANSQANLYLKTEGGVALKSGVEEPHLRVKLSADWETRRYFASYEVSGRHAGDFEIGSFHQKGRLGIAPYVADYGSLHTWLMVQVGHHPEHDSEIRVTPLLRFFKGDYLAEIGVDNEKDLLFNIIIRF